MIDLSLFDSTRKKSVVTEGAAGTRRTCTTVLTLGGAAYHVSKAGAAHLTRTLAT